MISNFKRNVLIIAHNYSPMNNSGIYRPVKFVKYLPQFGYNPIVISVKDYGVVAGEKNVYRFNELNAFLYKSRLVIFSFRILRKIAYKLRLISDYPFIWIKNVIKNIDIIIKEKNIKAVFCTFPPLASMLVGLFIKQKYNIPLISDFRDGLVFEPLRKENILRERANRYYENKIIKHSDQIITVSEPITQYFNDKYLVNAVTIMNGFDEDDFRNITNLNLGNNFNIIYTGRLSLSSKSLNIYKFVQVVSEINKINKNKKIKVYIVGELTKNEYKFFNAYLGQNFEYLNLLDHNTTLRYQKSGDLLLLVASSLRTSIITSKIFEYLKSGIPILALTKGTAAEEVIKKTKTGICVDPSDKKNIKIELLNIMNNGCGHFFKPDEKEISKYSRYNQTYELAKIFDKLLGI